MQNMIISRIIDYNNAFINAIVNSSIFDYYYNQYIFNIYALYVENII